MFTGSLTLHLLILLGRHVLEAGWSDIPELVRLLALSLSSSTVPALSAAASTPVALSPENSPLRSLCLGVNLRSVSSTPVTVLTATSLASSASAVPIVSIALVTSGLVAELLLLLLHFSLHLKGKIDQP